jgi:hypothetical protein
MSYYAYDVNGYLGDAASIGGWDDFRQWAQGQGGEMANLCRDGVSDDPSALAAELKAGAAPNDSADSVRANLATLAAKATEVFIIGDGETSI